MYILQAGIKGMEGGKGKGREKGKVAGGKGKGTGGVVCAYDDDSWNAIFWWITYRSYNE